MKVVVEGSPFENRNQLGVWRYLYEVLGRLAGRAEIALRVGGAPIQPLPAGVMQIRDASCLIARRRQLLKRSRRAMARILPKPSLRGAQVYHSTFFSQAWRGGPPAVVTVYDMIAETQYPICGPWALEDIARKREAIRAASRCICISQTTANELLRFYPEAAGEIRVIPLGADHVAAAPGSGTARGQSLLYVGHRNQYKNFAVILHAMALRSWPSAVNLRVAGSPAEPEDRDFVRALGLADRVEFVGRISDEQLAAEYRTAMAVLFPSLQEGFGLPLVEAQAIGCPVVCSDIPVFREVAGTAALFFDPRSPENLAEAVARLREPELQRELSIGGFNNMLRFSWDKAAEQTLAVYAEVAAEHSR